MPKLATLAVFLVSLLHGVAVGADPIDEPGLVQAFDEPGLQPASAKTVIVAESSPPASPAQHTLRLELGAGLSSLVVDPDATAGYGGGAYLGYEYGRFGAELTVFLARNNYSGQLGDAGSAILDSFIAGNISLGPTFLVTSPDKPYHVRLDVAFGTYPIANAIQQLVWTFGLSAGVSVGYRINRWFGVGAKLRYHLFNLTQFGGDMLLDRATLQEIGVVDRLEIPIYVGLYF
jgi:hypothetical protein